MRPQCQKYLLNHEDSRVFVGPMMLAVDKEVVTGSLIAALLSASSSQILTTTVLPSFYSHLTVLPCTLLPSPNYDPLQPNMVGSSSILSSDPDHDAALDLFDELETVRRTIAKQIEFFYGINERSAQAFVDLWWATIQVKTYKRLSVERFGPKNGDLM